MQQLNFTNQQEQSNIKSKWYLCLENTLDKFHRTISNMYLEKYFDKNTKNEVIIMSSNIKNQFLKIIQKVKFNKIINKE